MRPPLNVSRQCVCSWIAFLLLVHGAACCAAGVGAIRIPIELSSGEGCVYDAQHASLVERVAVPDDAGVIVLEAERPNRHFCDPAVRKADSPLPKDPDASGGAMLDAAVYARYDFRVDKEGSYDLWVRVATDVGRNRFIELLNGVRFTGPFVEDNEEKAQPYHWVKRATAKPKVGLNVFEVAGYHGPFPKVDKFVLAPSGAEEPRKKGPEEKIGQVAAGWIETAPLRVPGIQRIMALDGLPGQGVKASVTMDDGKTWSVMEGRPVSVGKTGSAVRFRLAVQRASDGKSPKVGPLALQAEVDPNVCIEVKNDTTRLLFDKVTGGLFLVQCLATDDAVVSPGMPRPLAAVEFKKKGEAEWLRVGPENRTKVLWGPARQKGRYEQKEQEPQASEVLPESVAVSGDRLEVKHLFAVDAVGKARLSYLIEPSPDGLWRFAATVESLEGPADVTGVMFPIFEHVRIGPSGLDDHQLRLQSFGHHAVDPGKGPIRDSRYLGGTVMPWTEVYDDRTGFYVCPHDPMAVNTLYKSKAGGQAAEFFHMSATKLDAIKPGEKRTYEYVVAAHPGQWHWGADRYRTWFYKTHGQAAYPKWMHALDGWIDLQAENYGRNFRFDQLPDWLTQARSVGLDWVQVWGQFAYDGGPCCCAIYPLSPLYGGAAGWKAAVEKITKRRGFVGGYFVYDRIDILPLVTDTFLGHFKKSDYPPDAQWPTPEFVQGVRLIDDPAGKIPPWPPADEETADYRQKVEEHQKLYAEGKRSHAIQWWIGTYLNDPRWIGYLRFWIVDKYVKEYGCNSTYIDVLGCGEAEESFDPRRGHNGEGRCGMGKMMIARQVVEDARKLNPDFAATQEGLGDLPALYCAPMCSGVYWGGRNVYRYTFPERILLHGCANFGGGGTATDRFLETHLEGMRYEIVGRPTALPVNLLRVRQRFSPWLYTARFMDTVGLDVSDPRVQARRHLVETDEVRGGIITLVNRKRLDNIRVHVKCGEIGNVRAAFFVGMSGAAGNLALKREGDEVSFDAPNELAVTILLPASVGKGAGVWPVLYLKRTTPPAAEITLLNLSDKPAKGACRIENLGFTEPFEGDVDQAREQLAFAQSSQEISINPLTAKTFCFPIRSLRKHFRTVRVKATVDLTDRGSITRTFLATPLVPDGSWEVFGTPDGNAVDGKRTLILPPSDSGFVHELHEIWLEPSRRYRLQVSVRRSGFTADLADTLLMVADPTSKPVWERKGLDKNRPNEWQAVAYEFETPPELERAGIYLYNVRSRDTAWFDDLNVEELPR